MAPLVPPAQLIEQAMPDRLGQFLTRVELHRDSAILSIMSPQLTDLPHGVHLAASEAIMLATLPEHGIVQRLLDGTEKTIVAVWFGDTDSDCEEDSVDYGIPPAVLTTPGHDLHVMPEGWMDEINIRAGIPFWVLAAKSPHEIDEPTTKVLGLGNLHPLFNSATLAVYSPRSGRFQASRYLCDSRLRLQDIPVREQQQQIRSMRGLGAVPLFAPRFHTLLP